MPKRITRLRIDEGSLVDEPANPGAQVLLWKRDDRLEKLDSALAGFRAEAADILATEPEPDRPRLLKEAFDWYLDLPERAETPTGLDKMAEPVPDPPVQTAIAFRAPTPPPEDPPMSAELTAMLKAARSGGDQRWSRQEIHDAMLEHARALASPGESPEQSMMSHSRDRTLSALYQLHEQAPDDPPISLRKEALVVPAWEEIERQAKALRGLMPSMSRDQAIAMACERMPVLYARYMQELQRSELV